MNTHLLPVPFEIAELINSFAYYDWPTRIRLEKERLFMEDLIYRMKHCFNNPMNETEPDWWVCWLSTDPDEEVQFQSCFCLTCGNYLIRRPSCTC
jgi:hypothetical protein